jgi:hypothetical protein
MSSAQALVRVGGPLDIYYQDSDNAKKQVIPTITDQRYTQEFNNKGQGTSVFTIPPNNGVSHVLLVMGYNASTVNDISGSFALQRGWGYEAIQQVSFRVGGSSQYFLTGAQLLARNLRLARTQTQRDAILSLGGNVLYGSATGPISTTENQLAYIPVSIWAQTGDDELNLPLPSDTLSQQIQVTVQLNPSYIASASPGTTPNTSGFWHLATGADVATLTAPPAQFDTAYFQVQQIQMKDRGMALANRVDLTKEMYSMALPGGFDQFEQTFQLSSADATSQPQSVVLTGFRAGEVKSLQFFLQPNVISGNSATYDAAANPNLWYNPQNLQVLYAGLVYANYLNGSAPMWNLLNGTAPSAVNQNVLTSAGGAWTAGANPQLSQWEMAPFAQPSGSDYEADVLVHGLEITNGIVNVSITPPPRSGVNAGVANAWTLHVIYNYNCALGFSRGTADLIF